MKYLFLLLLINSVLAHETHIQRVNDNEYYLCDGDAKCVRYYYENEIIDRKLERYPEAYKDDCNTCTKIPSTKNLYSCTMVHCL